MKYKLGEICEIVSGSTPKTSVAEYWDGDIKWITPAELTNESYIIDDSVRKLTELGVKKTGLTPFPAGTVILSSRAPIGKVAIAGCEMYCNQGFKNLICSDKINNKYLYWFLKGNTAFLNSLGRGATFKEISKGIVSNIEINVPDAESQDRAVCNLEKISEVIKMRKKEIFELDNLIKARFIEMFGDPRSNPFGFPKSMLKDTCKVVTGNTPSRAVQEYYGDFVEWIKTDNIVSGLPNPTKATESLSEEGMKVGRVVNKNSILMACIAGSITSIGKVCITDRTVAFNQQINAVVPMTKRILNILLPTIFPIAIPTFPLLAAVTEVTSSGRLVPNATIVSPMKRSLIPKVLAIADAESTTRSLPHTTMIPPATMEMIHFK